MSAFDDLVRLVPPPAAPVDAQGDWGAVEAALGVRLPGDYRELAERYGRGEFCDLFAHCPAFGEDSLVGRLAEWEWEQESRREFPELYPYPLHPEPGGLLTWGYSSNGHRLCWLTEGEPEDWPVVVWQSRDSDWELHRMGAAALLLECARGNLEPAHERGGAPWFDQPRELMHVYVRLDEGRHPYRKRLRILQEALAPTIDRGGLRGTQDHFVATAAQWRVTYETAYGHQIRIAFPPEDEERARTAVMRAADLMGCAIRSTTRIDGTPVWGDQPRSTEG